MRMPPTACPDRADVPARIPAPPTTLVIGCAAPLCSRRLSQALIALAGEWPQLVIGIRELPRAALAAGVRAGELGLALVPGPAPAGLATRTLWHDEVALMLPRDHPLAATDGVAPGALAGLPLLTCHDTAAADMHRFLAGHALDGLRAAIRMVGGDTDALLARVAAGEGMALLAAGCGERLPAGAVARAIVGAPRFEVRALWQEPALTAPARRMLALLRDVPEPPQPAEASRVPPPSAT